MMAQGSFATSVNVIFECMPPLPVYTLAKTK